MNADLHEELELLNSFLESAEDYAFITFDLENRITRWNRGAERILGYSEKEVLGQPGSLFFTPEDRLKHEVEREVEVACRFGRSADQRWHIRKDGTRFWGSGVMFALRNSVGIHYGYGKVFRDLTEHKLADELLRNSEERFRVFSENVLDYALVPVDAEFFVSGWNRGAERIFGFAGPEAINRPFSLFFAPEDVRNGEPERSFGTALREGRSEVERWLLRKDGSRLWARWVTTPMRDPGGVLRGFANVLHDETRRKTEYREAERESLRQRSNLETEIRFRGEALDRTREELRALAASLLRAQEDERRRIARELHDDLLQRLAMLEVRVARLRARLPVQSSIAAEFESIEEQISSLSTGVRSISHNLHPSILDDFGLPVALGKLAEEFSTLRNQRIRFESHDFPDDIPHEVGSVFYRVAQEALMNIIRHSGADPVKVVLDGRGSSLNLIIEDSGPGFDPDAARANGGLGIISMQERAQLIGATLALQSAPGHGTVVHLRLEPWQASEKFRPRSNSEESSREGSNK